MQHKAKASSSAVLRCDRRTAEHAKRQRAASPAPSQPNPCHLSSQLPTANAPTEPPQPPQDVLVNGPLGKSGFLAAFSLIFLSEIGDKTFFIAALLAMKLGKWISFAGSLSSLSVMTVISVGIGAVFSRVGGVQGAGACGCCVPAGGFVGACSHGHAALLRSARVACSGTPQALA